MQLPGYLSGRALQEWCLLGPTVQQDYTNAIEALRSRLDSTNRTMAAQDFRHSIQRQGESVADFIRRLEKAYQLAYGKDSLDPAVRDALLYGQMYDGLQYNIMKGPAESGAQNYQELCVAAKGEEHRLAALQQRHQLRLPSEPSNHSKRLDAEQTQSRRLNQAATTTSIRKHMVPSMMPEIQVICYSCGKPGHMARNCHQQKQESRGRTRSRTGQRMQTRTWTNQVVSKDQEATQNQPDLLTPENLLYSDSDEGEANARAVRVQDGGSRSQCIKVEVQGVPAYGLIDTGADITIIGGELFKRVATIARLKKCHFRKADKIPRTYDQRIFKLDGCMDLEVTFDGKTMCTPIYIKIDAADQLLLSEGVCRQLGVVTFHPNVEPWRGRSKKAPGDSTLSSTPAKLENSASATNNPAIHEPSSSRTSPETPGSPELSAMTEAKVPAVRVNLVQSVRLLPHQSQVVEVSLEGQPDLRQPLLLDGIELTCGVGVDTSLLNFDEAGRALTILSNPTGCSATVDEGSSLEVAVPVEPVELIQGAPQLPEPDSQPGPSSASQLTSITDPARVSHLHSKPSSWRKKELIRSVGSTDTLSSEQRRELIDFLGDHHTAFALEEHERGETDLVEFNIETEGANPRRYAPRRMPFAVREEVARQLKSMQEAHVIQPSSSPWSSPVVMVRKKDGSHRFCVDYRHLNAVTKSDTYPLPRIDDLLDQLGRCKYFSTLDLASGYWQIRVAADSREKTAFVTPQGLYEFLVMPFGLTNAPAVFQRLMQKVLAGLNPEAGPDFVAVYIDNVLIFSRTVTEHLDHLRAVIQRIEEAGLKLKPVKCHFARSEVEYLGHLVTPEGLKTNHRLVEAVAMFPTPTDVSEVRRFLGLASYYRRFIDGFARIAAPIRELTRKNSVFSWTVVCEKAMKTLKEKLTSSPVLAYPSFDKPFTVETDACINGLGAVLQQLQGDSKLHPVAYASRSLTDAERNYSITELEALAVVWALTRFHSYLYGQSVTVVTDHTAVKAVLETPNPSAKHARWWTRVYGTGLKDVHIVYRPGRLNADALSRSPHSGPPPLGEGEDETQVSAVKTSPPAAPSESSRTHEGDTIEDVLVQPPQWTPAAVSFAEEQKKDPEVADVITFLESGELPLENKRARVIALQKSLFVLKEGILYYADPKQEHRLRVVVPCHRREQILAEHHSGLTGGHFAAKKMYAALTRHWWWDGMHHDTFQFASWCPQCAVVTGGSRQHRPPLHPIPVSRPFQIIGVDVMELPTTEQGNRYVLVFQDFLTKWPMVYPMPDQKSVRVAKLLVNEVIPQFGVPEPLLSDRGTNLLSHLMTDVCRLLGIKKLNTTAYHPQCDGMVERFNRTLKTMLRKYAAEFSTQWDRYLPGALWAYRNLPHDSTGEKPSFLLYGVDCRTPSEAALLPPPNVESTEVSNYREEMVLSLSAARRLAAEAIRAAQTKYKTSYDRHSQDMDYQIGDWVLVRFPQDEMGRMRKLSRPWHGPYHVIEKRDPDITVVKIYAPQDGQIQVHQSRVVRCPPELPAGFYWYGSRRSSPGRPPRWVDKLLQGAPSTTVHKPESSADTESGSPLETSNTSRRNSELDDQDRERQQDSAAEDTCVLPDEQEELTSSTTHTRDRDQEKVSEEHTNVSMDRGCYIQDEMGNRNNTRTPIASDEARPVRSRRRAGLRTGTTPPTRLMTLHTVLEDEPPWRRGVM